MNNNRHQGILLRTSSPYRKKIILFDYELGLVECINPSGGHRLVHGAFLYYNLTAWNNLYKIHDIELIAVPAEWVREDLLFLHHMLELSSNFLTLHNNASEIFNFFINFYKPCNEKDLKLFKKLFICRFFSLLGVYPENSEDYEATFFRLISGPIDSMLNAWRDDALLHKKVNEWLQGCVRMHPYADHLKTVNFLTKMDRHES